MQVAFAPARLAVVCLPIMLAFAGCTSNSTPPTATFTGSVQLHDMYGNVLADNSGVTVSSYDNPASSTVTAVNGSFTLANVDVTTPPRLKMEKTDFGTYYTNELTTTAATYALLKTVQMGQYSTAQYQVTYTPNGTGRYLVVKGMRYPAGATDTKLLMHRVYFNFSIIDVYPLVYTSIYSRGFHNNLATGFSDTLRYDMLAAAKLYKSVTILVSTDNLAADSCIAPFRTYDPFSDTYSPVGFHRTYPANGYQSDYTQVSLTGF